ncbi:MAG: MFS transporter [Actinobacteria bacterium]|nr:MFS transporter [Actinomycetota bacterium]
MSDTDFERADPPNRTERLLARWRRVELPVGMALIAIGFVAVALGWYDASGTPDVRRQLQALISGGFGGLAAVVLGASLVQAHVNSKGADQLAAKFERVADALLDLAYSRERVSASADTQEIPAERPQAVTHVLASHASYHAPHCDLAADREGLRELTVDQAQREELRPCAVCLSSLETRS